MSRLVLSIAVAVLAVACTPPSTPPRITILTLPPASATGSAAPTASAVLVVPVDTAAASAPAPAIAAPLPRTHPKVECNAGERRFFACGAKEGTASRKIAACASDLGTPSASLALVYGDATHAEDEVRVPLSADGPLIRYSRYTRPLVTYLHLEMKRGAEVWDLSDESTDEGPKPEWSSGLVIRTQGKRERTLRCVARSRESLVGLEDYLKMSDPWF